MKNELKIFKVGSDSIPATEDDIIDVQKHVAEYHKAPRKINGKPVKLLNIVQQPAPGVLLVRVGSKNRPATNDDLKDAYNAFKTVYHSNSLSLVTHHAIEAAWLPLKEITPQMKKFFNTKTPILVMAHK